MNVQRTKVILNSLAKVDMGGSRNVYGRQPLVSENARMNIEGWGDATEAGRKLGGPIK